MSEHTTPCNTLRKGQVKDTNLTDITPAFNFNKYGIEAEDFLNEADKLLKQSTDDQKISGLFEIATANDVIKEALTMPDPKLLFPVLILENEFTILFADAGIGKTVFAMQTAIHIASNGHTVLYLDLELSKKQFQRRFTSEDGTPFSFPDNFFRVSFSRMKKLPKELSYEDYFFESLIPLIDRTNAKVMYLDNLTKLAAGDTDSAKAAIPILERLNELKDQYQLTIVVLEHNKKVDPTRPIHLNDLQGSKMKSNLVDSVFSIGRVCDDKHMRYLKQVKVRDGEVVYDTENVLTCELTKAAGYLSFNFLDFRTEYDLLKQLPQEYKEVRKMRAEEMRMQGMNNVQIAKELGISEGAVRKYFK